MTQPVVAVHGGAGGGREAQLAGIRAALDAALAVLRGDGAALDAVCAAVVVLEDDPHFNAGRGAAATSAGTFELDAGVMEGEGRRAGAVAAVTIVRNPVLAARAVLDEGAHVLYAGAGADAFARAAGLSRADATWFDASVAAESAGTVGAVALDAQGHVAAATSTGGRRGQAPGRVGDSPIVGAGVWADDRTCAVSATGHGELFIRTAFAHTVAERVAAGASLDAACAQALGEVGSLGGSGGCIAVSRDGDVALPFTTGAMPRGWATVDGAIELALR